MPCSKWMIEDGWPFCTRTKPFRQRSRLLPRRAKVPEKTWQPVNFLPCYRFIHHREWQATHRGSRFPRDTACPRGIDYLFFATAWLIVLMPFLFWWSTWFGRHLSDKQLSEFLNDQKHPRHIQHALVQLGERLTAHDASAARWYPDLVRLASYPVEEVRNTDAWVMGQDTTQAGFHDALRKMLDDPSPMVRGNAALSLVRFGDAAGRLQIVALLQPATIVAPVAGPRHRHRPRWHRDPSGRADCKITEWAANYGSALSDQWAHPDTFCGEGCGSSQARSWRPWILGRNKFGKRCEHFTWWASRRICPRFALINVICRRFPIASSSRPF